MKAYPNLRLGLFILLSGSACSVAGINRNEPAIPVGQALNAEIPRVNPENPEQQESSQEADRGGNADAEVANPLPSDSPETLPAPEENTDVPVAPVLPPEAIVEEEKEEVSTPPADPLKLRISSLPTEIRAGHGALQLNGNITGISTSRIIWKVSGEPGVDKGSISREGLYLPPANAASEKNIIITASLEDDPTVKDERVFKLIPKNQTFVSCTGNALFPIKSEIFTLPVTAIDLPDFSRIASSRVATLCKDDFEIPEALAISGVPGQNLREFFAIRSEVQLLAPVDGNYNFRLTSDDGVRLFVDGSLVIDHDGQHGATPKDGVRSLKAGKHALLLEYYQGPSDLALSLLWQIPGNSDFKVIRQGSFEAK